MTLYEQLKAIGAEIDNHESDLYVRSTPEVDSVILQYSTEKKYVATKFVSQIDGNLWWDVFAMYDPWWAGRSGTLP